MTDQQALKLGRELAKLAALPELGDVWLSSLGRIALKLAEPVILEGLREPSASMVESGCEARNMVANTEWTDGATDGVQAIERMLTAKVWQAMIDTRLSEIKRD